jgi:CRISPR-associated protein Cst2
MAKHLHLAIIFKASNLNYGESVGNILSLKKMASEGRNYSYISRQALRYDIVRLLKEIYGFEYAKPDNVGSSEIVIQFHKDSKIDQYPEIDFFGYMKTEKKDKKKKETDDQAAGKTKTRKAVIRLTDAISMEAFNNDIDFGTNKGLADRLDDIDGNNIFQAEIHKSYYTYTITCNLDDIGEDAQDKISLPKNEKAKRVGALCNVTKLLYRDIRGKRENLSPLFVIGGLYDCGNPFFYNRLKLEFKKEGNNVNAEMINDTLDITMPPAGSSVMSQTILGCVNGEFKNVDKLKIEAIPIEAFFTKLTTSIDQYYK